ncbi:protein-export chaperone SecB [Psychromarinibacter sp. C21-152]|uniref:Protein-export protein SecB n=1 Tax=Psychromarinibacter sediminicola TaxID=3033385 RepID=A0AAE3NSJ1_9RHOB|nr:protein-export chaperone SecB [Psychromarinibacter sediminicola]MDF0601287.1 protein-export chaperone SecB [Psychromarinibacter sediminicola]
MAETGDNAPAGNGEAAPQQQQSGPQMRILAQFVRDLSFENILSQKGLSGEVKPQVQVQVGLDAKKRQQEHQYEVSTKYTVTSKNQGTDDTLFVLEIDYAGLFHVDNVPEDQLHPFLMIECPRMLFPFARRIVSDMTRDGGFPPVNLDTVDFVALYRQQLQQRMAAQQSQGEQQPS